MSAPTSATSARPLRRSSIAARSDETPEIAPPSKVVAPPEKEHSCAIHAAMRCPVPERKLVASGAGSDSTRLARTASSASPGALWKKRWMISIVWSMKKVCSSQLTVDALNGGA